MAGWIDGWIDGWMDGWMGWIDRWVGLGLLGRWVDLDLWVAFSQRQDITNQLNETLKPFSLDLMKNIIVSASKLGLKQLPKSSNLILHLRKEQLVKTTKKQNVRSTSKQLATRPFSHR